MRLSLNKVLRLQSSLPVVRDEHSRSGEMNHLDIKKLGRIEVVSYRASPGTVPNASVGPVESDCVCAWTTTAAWSILNYWPTRRPVTPNWFVIRAAGWVARYGGTINLVKTDNGSGYRPHLFLTTYRSLATKPIKTKSYTTRNTGKAAQFIRASFREWAYKQVYELSAEREAALLPWPHDYSRRRPYSFLNNRPPISRIANREQHPCC
jgi:transposase InsO family protein